MDSHIAAVAAVLLIIKTFVLKYDKGQTNTTSIITIINNNNTYKKRQQLQWGGGGGGERERERFLTPKCNLNFSVNPPPKSIFKKKKELCCF